MSFILKGKYRRARASIEYAALFAIVCGALIAMHVYINRSFQGRFRMLGDEIGQQYEQGATNINNTTVTTTHTDEYEIKPDPNADDTNTIIYTDSTIVDDKYEEVTGN